MKSIEQWHTSSGTWTGEPVGLSLAGGPDNPAELASVGMVLGDWMELDGTQRVLDVGCASSGLPAMWAHRALAVTGVDSRASVLLHGPDPHAAPNLELVHASGTSLPFEDAAFDRVCCFGVLHRQPDHDFVGRAVDEIIRVARPECRIILGSLPDARCKRVFSRHCESLYPWYQRMVRRMAPPGGSAVGGEMLWFDVPRMSQELRERGFVVGVENDPEFADHGDYRKTLVLSRHG